MSIFSRVVGMVARNAEAGDPAYVAVMSPLQECDDERKILIRLFESGLVAYHLRRPYWTLSRCRAWIESIPAKWRSRIVVHQFPQLVRKYDLAGFHAMAGTPLPVGNEWAGKVSVQCEDFQSLLESDKRCRRVMIGPVFPPEKYDVTIPRRCLEEYAAMVAYWRKQGGTAEVVAFGGISADNIRRCRKAGFSGVVVVGAVWDADDPVKAFKKLSRRW